MNGRLETGVGADVGGTYSEGSTQGGNGNSNSGSGSNSSSKQLRRDNDDDPRRQSFRGSNTSRDDLRWSKNATKPGQLSSPSLPRKPDFDQHYPTAAAAPVPPPSSLPLPPTRARSRDDHYASTDAASASTSSSSSSLQPPRPSTTSDMQSSRYRGNDYGSQRPPGSHSSRGGGGADRHYPPPSSSSGARYGHGHSQNYNHSQNTAGAATTYYNSYGYPVPSHSSSSTSPSSSSASTHPSPSTCSTGSSSTNSNSLRTPPDLLTVAYNGGVHPVVTGVGSGRGVYGGGNGGGGGGGGTSSGSGSIGIGNGIGSGGRGEDGGVLYNAKRFLSISDIDHRLKLLDSLTNDLDPSLPSAPEVEVQSGRRGLPKEVGTHAANDSAGRESTGSRRPEEMSTSKEVARDSNGSRGRVNRKRASPVTRDYSSSSSGASEDEGEIVSQDTRGRSSSRHRRQEERGGNSIKARSPESRHRKKIKAGETTARDYTPSPPPPDRARQLHKDAGGPSKRSHASNGGNDGRSSTPLPARTWSKERFVSTGQAFQSRGRALKHSGDRRLREASTASYSSSSKQVAAQQAATFEHTEAILLFIYAFWCEDAAANWNSKSGESSSSSSSQKSCSVANWSSLSGLLHYVCANHEKQKNPALAGFCRMLEGLVLRHTAIYEQRQVQHRLSRLASQLATGSAATNSNSPSSLSTLTAPSPGGTASAASPSQSNPSASAPSPSNQGTITANVQEAIADLSSSMARIVSDEERATKLLSQARSQLSNAVLREYFPDTWKVCIDSPITEMNRSASDLDPSVAGASCSTSSSLPIAAQWSWPLTGGSASASAFPHVVNFGRALLNEAACRGDIAYRLAEVGEAAR